MCHPLPLSAACVLAFVFSTVLALGDEPVSRCHKVNEVQRNIGPETLN